MTLPQSKHVQDACQQVNLLGRVVLVLMACGVGRGANVVVSYTNEAAIKFALSSACKHGKGGTVTLPNGTYPIFSGVSMPASCTLRAQNKGGAVLSGQGLVLLTISTNDVTIDGLTFDGGKVYVSGWPTNNLKFINNTLQNVTKIGLNDVLHIEAITDSLISGNKFSNLWWGGDWPNFPPGFGFGTGSTNADKMGPVALHIYNAATNTTISNNVFDKVGNDALNIVSSHNNGTGSGGPVITIDGNEFIHVFRANIEIQQNLTNAVISGNYIHDETHPFWNSWGYSLAADGSTNVTFVNNTGTMNSSVGCEGFLPAFLEVGGSPYLVQGNVATTAFPLPGCTSKGPTWMGAGQGSAVNTADKNIYQNNVFCGSGRITQVTNEVQNHAAAVDQYNYRDGSSCPGGSSFTESHISGSFSTADNPSSVTGKSATWHVAVVSNLSIRNVQFFVDNSTSPVSTQTIQDVNKNFAKDRGWVYHVTIDTARLARGSHTLTAKATDVVGNTKSMSEPFSLTQ